MACEIRYSQNSVEQLKKLRAVDKSLRQPAPTQYRLRVGDFRVFYDVEGEVVQIVQILSKEDSIAYLEVPHDGPKTNGS